MYSFIFILLFGSVINYFIIIYNILFVFFYFFFNNIKHIIVFKYKKLNNLILILTINSNTPNKKTKTKLLILLNVRFIRNSIFK